MIMFQIALHMRRGSRTLPLRMNSAIKSIHGTSGQRGMRTPDDGGVWYSFSEYAKHRMVLQENVCVHRCWSVYSSVCNSQMVLGDNNARTEKENETNVVKYWQRKQRCACMAPGISTQAWNPSRQNIGGRWETWTTSAKWEALVGSLLQICPGLQTSHTWPGTAYLLQNSHGDPFDPVSCSSAFLCAVPDDTWMQTCVHIPSSYLGPFYWIPVPTQLVLSWNMWKNKKPSGPFSAPRGWMSRTSLVAFCSPATWKPAGDLWASLYWHG